MKVAFLICNLVTCIAVMQILLARGVTKTRRRAVRFSADNGVKEALHDESEIFVDGHF